MLLRALHVSIAVIIAWVDIYLCSAPVYTAGGFAGTDKGDYLFLSTTSCCSPSNSLNRIFAGKSRFALF